MPFTDIATSPASSSATSSCFPSSLPPKQPRPIGNGQSQSENANSLPRRGHNSRNHNNNNHPCTHNLMNINKAYNNNSVGDKKGLRRGKDTAVVVPVGVSSIIQCARNNYCRRRSSSKGRCESEESSYRSYNDNFDLLPDAAHTHISAFVSANGSENDNDLLNHNQNQPKAPHDHLEDELKYFTDQVERIQLPTHRPASLALQKDEEETEFDLEFYPDNISRKNVNKSSKSCFSVPDDFKQDFFHKTSTTKRKQGPKPTFTSYLGLGSPSSHVAAATASSWLWQKSLSEGNLSSVSAVDAGEKSRRYHLAQDSKSNSKAEQCQQQQENVAGKSLMSTGGGRTRLFRNNSLGPGDYYYKDKTHDDDENEMVLRPNPVPKFFRSISLRNLLQIGGMNKSRPAPAQGKRVSPPTAPLVSFPSFRVKKSQQQQQQQKSETFELQQQHTTQQEKEQQRYSGSSLGSAGSSYASSGSSGSDNRSSIGTDDGYLVSPTVYANGYLKDLDEYHPVTQGILLSNSSNTYESFASSALCAPSPHHSTDMHQSLYAKVGGTNSGSNGASNNGPGGTNGVPSPHVTVHVDPHPHPISNSTGAGSGSLQQQPHNQNLHQLHGGPNNVFQPSSHNQPLTTSHYQTQISLEDQGIDMTQSPGRESPSSTASSNTGSGSGSAIGSVGSGSGSNGCRHSTASFDSGRASSTIYQGVRYSGLSSESSSGSFRHSYHSSSSSLGSIPPEEICNFDVSAMISQGIPDHEVLNAWLTGIHFECYYQNFIQAGYDMHTISRMTPEDLNAIGVTKPHHRKRLKSEISQLNISDGLPEYIPASIEEWLGLLKLEEYNIKLRGQGYHSVRQVTNITWEDLEDIGILKLGHQKKFMLAIKRVEDILAGKRIPSTTTPNAYLTPLQRPMSNTSTQHIGMPYSHPNQNNIPANSTNSHQYHHHPASFPRGLTPQQHQLQQNLWRQQQQQQNSSASSIYSTGMQMQLHTHQPQIHNLPQQQQQQQQSQNQPVGVTQPQYHPEVISIHVKNGRRKSLDNPDEEPIYGTSSFLPSTTSGSTWQRSQSKMPDDGETTPTNESSNSYYSTSTTSSTNSSTSTLPRLLKNKPISKIMGGADLGNNYLASPSQGQPAQNPQVPHYGDGYKSLPRDIGRLSKTGLGIYQQSGYANAGATGTLGKNSGYGAMGKNGPPPPPRRGSCSGEPLSGHFNSFQAGNLGFSANNGSWANLPPPPPTLSCDAQFTTPSKSTEEFPPPPPPDDLVMMSPQSVQSSSSSSKSAASSTSTSSSTSPNNPSQPLKMSTVVSHVAQSSYHNTTNSTGYHPSNVNSNAGGGSNIGGGGVMRTSPPHVKSRDPSPVGSDFSDSDLPANNGLLSRGVRRNGSDASFKSSSSTESESIPFANDNAGTIKQQKPGSRGQTVANSSTQPTSPENDGTGDVLNDIGNMLADLTDELDAILEQEMSSKR